MTAMDDEATGPGLEDWPHFNPSRPRTVLLPTRGRWPGSSSWPPPSPTMAGSGPGVSPWPPGRASTGWVTRWSTGSTACGERPSRGDGGQDAQQGLRRTLQGGGDRLAPRGIEHAGVGANRRRAPGMRWCWRPPVLGWGRCGRAPPSWKPSRCGPCSAWPTTSSCWVDQPREPGGAGEEAIGLRASRPRSTGHRHRRR